MHKHDQRRVERPAGEVEGGVTLRLEKEFRDRKSVAGPFAVHRRRALRHGNRRRNGSEGVPAGSESCDTQADAQSERREISI
jgi:hypothetical protein